MRAAIFAVALLLGAACGDNINGARLDAGAEDHDAAPDPDAEPAALAPCLDTPAGELRPPGTGGLPCDLLPPGFAL